ncbi:ABC transporter ATP-binding protein [Euzebya pacifica]|uniref:ABC transporter ATP-binding protein n=1 Tax=Euzebya pacifica TaxID=1608957 RepID=UPI0030F5FBBB
MTATSSTTSPADVDAVTADGRPAVVLSARGITKSYVTGIWPRRRRLDVLRGADLQLRAGEIVGLVGENGSGKSTMMKILVGALDRDEGTIQRQGALGYCPQEPILYERLTCDEHFELFGQAYGLTRSQSESARTEIYQLLGFDRWAGARVEELSGGTAAKLNLGLALLPDPQILLLDEPYAGFDWDTYQRFWDLTRTRRDAGRSLLIISHFITDEDRFDRIYDLREGRTVPR